jgi:hypothetical protein
MPFHLIKTGGVVSIGGISYTTVSYDHVDKEFESEKKMQNNFLNWYKQAWQ